MNALVLAIAGMIFLATPSVSISVTPSILYCFALANDLSKIHFMCSKLSLSLFVSGYSFSHSTSRMYWIQCSGVLGVLAIVQ